ncbi:MAG: flagellar export chaperone FliS [Luminiphilus sp.]
MEKHDTEILQNIGSDLTRVLQQKIKLFSLAPIFTTGSGIAQLRKVMTRGKAAAAYKRVDLESAVASADEHQLVSLLFKALIGALSGVEVHHQHGNRDQAREYLTKASRILAGLQGSLDYERGGEIAVNLGQLYGYSIRKLFAANVNTDVAPENITEVKSLLEPIAEAWESMDLSKPRQLMAV